MLKRTGKPGGMRGGQRAGAQVALAAVLFCPLIAAVGQVAPASQSTGQVAPAAQPSYGRPSFGADHSAAPDPMGMPNPHRLEKMREEDRHKRLQADMAKLVELTNELKAEVDKTSKDELSVDVVKKAAEIEKLARDVKERMKS